MLKYHVPITSGGAFTHPSARWLPAHGIITMVTKRQKQQRNRIENPSSLGLSPDWKIISFQIQASIAMLAMRSVKLHGANRSAAITIRVSQNFFISHLFVLF